jgi:AGZA family xanthine/uracil permease-like MFS transporter
MARYRWAAWGDVNAFFGLMLDNVTVMMVLAVILTTAGSSPEERFTHDFVLTRMIPGSAMGVLIGDLVYTWLAFRLARRTGRSDVTAMPLGIDAPSTFALPFLVLLPALEEGRTQLHLDHPAAMVYAWHVGAVVLVLVGVFKALFAPLGNRVRQWVPRAGLLGSLAAVALALIAFLPVVQEIARVPLVGLAALTVILVTLVAHRPLPGNVPGALAAVGVGVGVYYAGQALGPTLGMALVPAAQPLPAGTQEAVAFLPALDWGRALGPAVLKLPVVLPFALATIVGGIDCTESAAAAGDEYDTRTILLTEGLASLAAGLFGGVLQNTPYIGHPAFKAMGGRAAYTLATALFVGAAGYFGGLAQLIEWLPQAAMVPILVFVGLEITAQSFRATPVRHYPAVALATIPALAAMAAAVVGQILGPRDPAPGGVAVAEALRCLNNGFIVTSLLWGAALAALIDGRFHVSAAYLGVAGACALFGVIHSPLPAAPIAWPGTVVRELATKSPDSLLTPYHWAAGYGLAAVLVLALSAFPAPPYHEREAAGERGV